jgi:hypothetical protein
VSPLNLFQCIYLRIILLLRILNSIHYLHNYCNLGWISLLSTTHEPHLRQTHVWSHLPHLLKRVFELPNKCRNLPTFTNRKEGGSGLATFPSFMSRRTVLLGNAVHGTQPLNAVVFLLLDSSWHCSWCSAFHISLVFASCGLLMKACSRTHTAFFV